MELKDCNTKTEKYTHLKESERCKIEVLLKARNTPNEIAQILGRSRSTIYRELNRGSVVRLQYDLSYKKQYRADVAQKDYRKKAKGKQFDLRIGKDKQLEEYLYQKIIKEKFSPDAAIGSIKEKRLKFKGMICTKTLYNYIDKGIFAWITNESLWEKRKRRKKGYKRISRVSRTNRTARSIEQRPQRINDRHEYGHWEGDCIKGPKGHTTSLFTLTERVSLEQIIIKIERSTQEEIQVALDKLEKKYKSKFKIKFKSITFDNGVEFLDWKSLELSTLDPKQRRTITYFAHAYSAWERGSNENQNRMIRRFIPKGVDIHTFSKKEIKEIETWINNYPRKKLNYKSATQVARKLSRINNKNGA